VAYQTKNRSQTGPETVKVIIKVVVANYNNVFMYTTILNKIVSMLQHAHTHAQKRILNL